MRCPFIENQGVGLNIIWVQMKSWYPRRTFIIEDQTTGKFAQRSFQVGDRMTAKNGPASALCTMVEKLIGFSGGVARVDMVL